MNINVIFLSKCKQVKFVWGIYNLDWGHHFVNFMFERTTLPANTIFRYFESWLAFFILIVRQIIEHNNNWVRTLPFFPDYDEEHTAGKTGQQRRITPQWHLILPLKFQWSAFFCFALFCNFLWTFKFEDCLFSPHISFYYNKVKRKENSLEQLKIN